MDETDLSRLVEQKRCEAGMIQDAPVSLSEATGKVIARLNTPAAIAEQAARTAATAERAEREKRRCIEQRRRDLWNERGRRYVRCALENYHTDTREQAAAIARLKSYRDNIAAMVKQGVGICLTGTVGTGKDHLLAALFNSAIDSGLSLRWTSGALLYARFRDGISREEDEHRMLADYIRPDVLVLSDPMPIVGGLTQYQRSSLYAIIDARYNDCRPVWVSLNAKNSQEASDALGEATVDRLRDGAVSIVCDWPSYRRSMK